MNLKSFVFMLLLSPLCQASSLGLVCQIVYHSQRSQITKSETHTLSEGKTISIPYGSFFLDIRPLSKNEMSRQINGPVAEVSIWAHRHTTSMAQAPIYLDLQNSFIEYNNTNTKESLSAECSLNKLDEVN